MRIRSRQVSLAGDRMDYPERWRKKLATPEEREEIARRHWRPTLWHVLVLLLLGALFRYLFWPEI